MREDVRYPGEELRRNADDVNDLAGDANWLSNHRRDVTAAKRMNGPALGQPLRAW